MSQSVELDVLTNPVKSNPTRKKKTTRKRTGTRKRAKTRTRATTRRRRASTPKRRTRRNVTVVPNRTRKRRRTSTPKRRARRNVVTVAANPRKRRTRRNPVIVANPRKRKYTRRKTRRNPIDVGNPRDMMAALFIGLLGWIAVRLAADLSTTIVLRVQEKAAESGTAKPVTENAARIIRIVTRVVIVAGIALWIRNMRGRATARGRAAAESFLYGASFGALLGSVEDIVYMVCGKSDSDSCNMMKIAARSDQNIPANQASKIVPNPVIVGSNYPYANRNMGMRRNPNYKRIGRNPVITPGETNALTSGGVWKNETVPLAGVATQAPINPAGSWNAPRSRAAQNLGQYSARGMGEMFGGTRIPKQQRMSLNSEQAYIRRNSLMRHDGLDGSADKMDTPS